MAVDAAEAINRTIHWPSVVRHYRLSAGLNQTQLADQLAVTQTMVSRWEAGGADPSRRIQELIFDLYWSVSATISRDVWHDRLRINPSIQAVVEGSGRIRAASAGLLKGLGVERSALEGQLAEDCFTGDLIALYRDVVAAGFFEGRVALAESISLIEPRNESGKPVYGHALHKPIFMPGPEVLWLAVGAVVPAEIGDDIRQRLGGSVVIKRAL